MKKFKFQGFLTTSWLKIIAITSMTIDHYALYFLGNSHSMNYILLRIIGRLAMPIFCFTLVQGFINTRNIKKYLARMVIMMLVSETVYDWINNRSFFYLGSQSIMVTLFVSLVMLCILEYIYDRFSNVKLRLLLSAATILLFGLLNLAFKGSYGIFGVVTVSIFYIFRKHKFWMSLCFVAASTVYSVSGTTSITQIFGVLALVPILLYNRKKGLSLKYLFYIYYPIHLLVFSLFVTVPTFGVGVVTSYNRKSAEMPVENYCIKHCPVLTAPYSILGANLEEQNKEIVTIPLIIKNSDTVENSYIYSGNNYFITENYGILLTNNDHGIVLTSDDIISLDVELYNGQFAIGSESNNTKKLELDVIKDGEVVNQIDFSNVVAHCNCQCEIHEAGKYMFLVKNLSEEKLLVTDFKLTIS
jgi:hypothetical protein